VTFNPARIRTPLRRVAGRKGSGEARCEPASWDEDLDAVADKLLTLRDSREAHALANRTTGCLPRGLDTLVARVFTMLARRSSWSILAATTQP
jgi:formate dehydrogenase (coenzyme F420) alpha subunit